MQFLTDYHGVICFLVGIFVGGAGGIVILALFSCTDEPEGEL